MRAAITMLVAATTIGLSVSPATANVVDGSLDPSFGSDGIVTVDFPGYAPQANAVLVRPNGQAVLAGGDLHEPPSPNVLLAGLRRDGSLDPRFGSGGRVVTPLTATDGAEGAVAIAQQTNKRFIVGASTLVFGELGFALLGYLRNGTLDPSFGVGGITTALPAPQGAALQALVIQPDRKIVAVGGGNDAEGNATFVAARFTPSGALDPTFAGTGTRIIDTPEGDAEASAVTLQRDGKIVIAGTAQTSTGAYNTFARLNADGTNDTTFGDGGLVLMQTSDDQDLGGMAAVAIQRDGKIVGAGLGGTDQNFIGQFAVVRLLPNGALDPAFGNGQGFVTTMVDADSVATDIVLRHNGDMIAAGAGGPEGDESTFALVSYEPDGSLNEDFGTGGIVQTPIGAISGITDVAPFGRKRLLAVGGTGSGDGASLAAARYVLS